MSVGQGCTSWSDGRLVVSMTKNYALTPKGIRDNAVLDPSNGWLASVVRHRLESSALSFGGQVTSCASQNECDKCTEDSEPVVVGG